MSIDVFLTQLQVGMGQPEVVVPITALQAKELVLKGSFRYGVRIACARIATWLT
jgi:hypothetical protein